MQHRPSLIISLMVMMSWQQEKSARGGAMKTGVVDFII